MFNHYVVHTLNPLNTYTILYYVVYIYTYTYTIYYMYTILYYVVHQQRSASRPSAGQWEYLSKLN